MLFQWGNFKLHSGEESWWRIDCDALSDSEIELFAKLIREKIGPFTEVICPDSHHGSAAPKLVRALYRYKSDWLPGRNIFVPLLVDDVLTTGKSLEELKMSRMKIWPHGAEPVGIVLFARGECPDWITPVFRMG